MKNDLLNIVKHNYNDANNPTFGQALTPKIFLLPFLFGISVFLVQLTHPVMRTPVISATLLWPLVLLHLLSTKSATILLDYLGTLIN